MSILEGLLFINSVDALTAYGAFLCEDKPGDNKNYAALLKPARAKPHTCVDFREQDGERYPVTLAPALEARDITLQFAMVAPTLPLFMSRYSAFITALKQGSGGWVSLRLADIGKTYKLIYLDCTEWDQLTDLSGELAATFKVKFREPNPTY